MRVVPIYYDCLNDVHCQMTEYIFGCEEIAQSFRQQAVHVHEWIYACATFEGEKHGERPIFRTVEEAIQDLEQFIQGKSTYCYKNDIMTVPIERLHLLIFQSECAYLAEENKELKKRLANYETI